MKKAANTTKHGYSIKYTIEVQQRIFETSTRVQNRGSMHIPLEKTAVKVIGTST